MTSTAQATQPASGLARVFEKSEAALTLVSQRLESDMSVAFKDHPNLNPLRLTKRLAALEAELPKLKEAAEKNAMARRAILGALHAQQCSNQAKAMELAGRASAPVQADDEAWQRAEKDARSQLASNMAAAAPAAPAPAAPAMATPSGPPPRALRPPATTASSIVAVQPPARPPPLSAASDPSVISELSFLRLTPTVRDGISLETLNEFWGVLRSLFIRRETQELQAAQLLALGVRMSEENARRMRVLEALGLLKLQANAVHLVL